MIADPVMRQIEEAMLTLWPAAVAALGGREPEVQAAILADLVATWLAGHIVFHNRAATDAMREELLQFHIAAVRELIPVNEKIILDRIRRQ